MSSARSTSDLASAQFSAEDDGSPWYDHSTLGSPCLFSEAGSAHSDTGFGEFELPRDVDDLTVAPNWQMICSALAARKPCATVDPNGLVGLMFWNIPATFPFNPH